MRRMMLIAIAVGTIYWHSPVRREADTEAIAHAARAQAETLAAQAQTAQKLLEAGAAAQALLSAPRSLSASSGGAASMGATSVTVTGALAARAGSASARSRDAHPAPGKAQGVTGSPESGAALLPPAPPLPPIR